MLNPIGSNRWTRHHRVGVASNAQHLHEWVLVMHFSDEAYLPEVKMLDGAKFTRFSSAWYAYS
jgi:hypothetical protein